MVHTRPDGIGEWPAAVALAGMPQLVAALLAAHVDDGQRRCRACRSQVRAAAAWPCALHLLAATAQRSAERGRP